MDERMTSHKHSTRHLTRTEVNERTESLPSEIQDMTDAFAHGNVKEFESAARAIETTIREVRYLLKDDLYRWTVDATEAG